jgi:hypothetical protein
MMLLSLIDVPLDLYKWREGYTHGRPGVQHILDSVLLFWESVDNRVELNVDESVLYVYGHNSKVNPGYKEFKPLIEQGREHRGFPAVDLSMLGPTSRARMHLEDAPFQMKTLGLLENLMGKEDAPSKFSMYEVGSPAG